MTLKKAFIYTTLVFALITLISYVASAQARRLSLHEALSLTLANNREIKISSLDVDRSQQSTQIAKSAGLPSAGISAQVYHYFYEPPFFGFKPSGSSGDKIPYSRFGGRDQAAGIAWINQPVYNAATKPGIVNAQLQERQSRLSVINKETDIAALLKQTYIRILVLQERIKLQKESLARNEKALQDAKSLLAQGRALRVDTLRAYTSVKNLEPDLLKLSYAIETGKQQLRTLTGLDSLQEMELTDSLTLPESMPTFSEEEVYQEAKVHRADLQSLDLQQQQADQQIKIAAAGMKPSVSLNAQYLIQTQANQFNYFNAFYPSTPFVAAQVTVPIFNGNINKAKVTGARIEKKQSVLRSQQAYEELRTAVKQAIANVRETAARIQTAANVQETARLSYEITQYRYAKAVASRLELTDAELAYTQAQSNYLEAVYDYLSANIEIERTMGGDQWQKGR
ncbi:MAG TPA: TolC family protein [Puia sp.]|nr:TolC family protein [Puia sp.]